MSRSFTATLLLLFSSLAINSNAMQQVDDSSINAQDEYGNTQLILAARRNNVEKCKELLAGHADFTIRNSMQKTPLMVAAQYGNVAIVKLLIEAYNKQLELQSQISRLDTCINLHVHSFNVNKDFINEVDCNGQTAVMLAMLGRIDPDYYGELIKTLTVLRSLDLNLDIEDRYGYTAHDYVLLLLHESKKSDYMPVFKDLE